MDIERKYKRLHGYDRIDQQAAEKAAVRLQEIYRAQVSNSLAKPEPSTSKKAAIELRNRKFSKLHAVIKHPTVAGAKVAARLLDFYPCYDFIAGALGAKKGELIARLNDPIPGVGAYRDRYLKITEGDIFFDESDPSVRSRFDKTGRCRGMRLRHKTASSANIAHGH